MNTKKRTRFFQTCLGVFQGGGCRGAAFVGAVAEAKSRGVDFAGVAGTSAGSIVAALLGAGATPEFLSTTVGALDFKSLLKEPEAVAPEQMGISMRLGLGAAQWFFQDAPKIWKYRGLHSSEEIESWVNRWLNKLLPEVKGRVKFVHLPIPTYIVATDLVANDVTIWSPDTPDHEVADAVRCSCSIPGFFQPVRGRYMDGGILSNLPSFVFSLKPDYQPTKPFAKRILAFTLIANREEKSPNSNKELFEAAVNTIVDGASKLQGRLVHPVHQIAIETGNIQATDFANMDSSKVSYLIDQGKAATQQFFEDELSRVQSSQQRANVLFGEDEIYAALTEVLSEVHINHIVITDEQTRWAYSLFPSLLAWRSRGARIQVVLNTAQAGNPHEMYRRRLLSVLGAELYYAPLPFKGFLLNPENEGLGLAIVIPEAPGLRDLAVRYDAPTDFAVIQGLWLSLKSVVRGAPNESAIVPKVVQVSEALVLNKLKQYVKPYATAGTKLAMETVPLRSILLMTRLVRGYKFQQIETLFELFKAAKLEYFEAAAVQYSSELSTLVTPPVVELSADRYIAVQGNTRALYCYKNGIDEMRCVVVRDPASPLPSPQRNELKKVLIGDRTIPSTDRYGADIDKDYRSIEWATHRPEETLASVKL